MSTTTIPESAVLRRSFRKSFPSAVRGEGVYIFDAEGKRYLDFAGSAVVNFIGHGVREISEAMAEQAGQLEFVHTSQFTTPIAEAYAEELLEFAGENFRGGAVYFTSGGSESIETALKLARQYQVEIGQPRALSNHQPPAELSRLDAGRAVGFRQPQAPRDVPAHGEGVRARRHAVLLSLQIRLHRQLPQLRPTIRCRTQAGDRRGQRRSSGVHLRTAERCDARGGCTTCGISREDCRSLPCAGRAAHC